MAVTIHSAGGDRVINAQVAATPEQQERGLMFRRSLAPNEGMIFPYDPPASVSFWMHNTLIPLDMLFITKDMTVAGIVQNAEPKTDTMRTVGATSLYVLEVNGGYTASKGVIAGAKVRFDNVQ